MKDLISRQAAIDAVKQREWLTEDAKEILEEVLKQLPSVQPQRWIPVTERQREIEEDEARREMERYFDDNGDPRRYEYD